jgi:hypothetical protein
MGATESRPGGPPRVVESAPRPIYYQPPLQSIPIIITRVQEAPRPPPVMPKGIAADPIRAPMVYADLSKGVQEGRVTPAQMNAIAKAAGVEHMEAGVAISDHCFNLLLVLLFVVIVFLGLIISAKLVGKVVSAVKE